VSVCFHLSRAMEIMRRQPDPMQWGALIDALTPEEQAEVRPYLRMQAKLVLRRRQATSTSQTQPFTKASRTPRK
jgi:hypothetical protein